MLYGDALKEIVDTLKAEGIPATTEAAQVQLPGALVVPGPMSLNVLDLTSYAVSVDVYLLTSNKGSVQSLNDLQGLLEKFAGIYPVPQADPITIPLANVGGPDPVPGLLITLDLQVTKE